MEALSSLAVALLLVGATLWIYRWIRNNSRPVDLESRYIFVTGCDTGFGRMLVRRLDGLGCCVLAGCLTESGRLDLQQVCTGRVSTIRLDVTDSDSVSKAYDYVSNLLPASSGLWGLVNNAATAGVSAGPLEWHCADDFRKVIDVNLIGLIDVTMTFLPLIRRSRGRIINMSSTGGRLAGPIALPLDVSKHGVEAFSDGLRRHLKLYNTGVTVHVIQPSIFKTEMLDPEKHRRLFESTWRRLTSPAREQFGQSFYTKYVSYALDSMDRFASTEYHKVVDAYMHALTSAHPKIRYSVGYRATYFSLPLSYLPSALIDWIVCFVHPRIATAQPNAICRSYVNNRSVRFTTSMPPSV